MIIRRTDDNVDRGVVKAMPLIDEIIDAADFTSVEKIYTIYFGVHKDFS